MFRMIPAPWSQDQIKNCEFLRAQSAIAWNNIDPDNNKWWASSLRSKKRLALPPTKAPSTPHIDPDGMFSSCKTCDTQNSLPQSALQEWPRNFFSSLSGATRFWNLTTSFSFFCAKFSLRRSAAAIASVTAIWHCKFRTWSPATSSIKIRRHSWKGSLGSWKATGADQSSGRVSGKAGWRNFSQVSSGSLFIPLVSFDVRYSKSFMKHANCSSTFDDFAWTFSMHICSFAACASKRSLFASCCASAFSAMLLKARLDLSVFLRMLHILHDNFVSWLNRGRKQWHISTHIVYNA